MDANTTLTVISVAFTVISLLAFGWLAVWLWLWRG